MNILVTCVDDKEYEYRCVLGELNYSPNWPYFWMRCVIGDDWFQRTSCDMRTPPIDFRKIDSLLFVLYQSRQDAEAFSAWLRKAKADVAEGYRTMRG